MMLSQMKMLMSSLFNFAEKYNVLWRENWTIDAGKVLKRFEQEVIRKAKNDGYDGQDDKNKAQWNFSGALLYSVTVITTIGTKLSMSRAKRVFSCE